MKVTEEELRQANWRGYNAAKKIQEKKIQERKKFASNWNEVLLRYVDTCNSMHELAKEGNEEALKQEAYLKGFLKFFGLDL